MERSFSVSPEEFFPEVMRSTSLFFNESHHTIENVFLDFDATPSKWVEELGQMTTLKLKAIYLSCVQENLFFDDMEWHEAKVYSANYSEENKKILIDLVLLILKIRENS